MNSGMGDSLLSNESGIGNAVQGSGMGLPTLQERGIGDAQQFLRQDMMSSGSNSGRGIPTATSDSIMRAVGEGMGKNLNDVMMQTQGIQNKYGNPDDKSVQQIMSEFNVNEAENAFQGMDNNRTFSQKIADRYDVTKNFRDNEIDMKVMYDTDPRYKAHPSYGEAKGLNVLNAPFFGRTKLPSVLDDMVGGVQTAAMFGGDLLYQGGQAVADPTKSFSNVIPSAYEQARAYALGRFDPSINVSNAQSLFDSATKLEPDTTRIDQGKVRDEAIKQRIADKTFVPMKKAQAYEPPKQTVADRKGYTPKPVAKPKVKVNYNRNKPVAVKSKPVRTPTPKPTRTTGSRGGRGNVGARRRLTGGR